MAPSQKLGGEVTRRPLSSMSIPKPKAGIEVTTLTETTNQGSLFRNMKIGLFIPRSNALLSHGHPSNLCLRS